jgi:hypothetical protein
MSEARFAPEAYFDCLSIIIGAPSSVAPLTARELHLFAYLACLLALFEGKPIADWGYQFALTSRGFPHSAEFENARLTLVDTGMLAPVDVEWFAPTNRAVTELSWLSELAALSCRKRWLSAATDCALALPVGLRCHSARGSYCSYRIRATTVSRDAFLYRSDSQRARHH